MEPESIHGLRSQDGDGEHMKVSLVVDGVEIPLNDFTQQIIGNVSAGMASSLRGVSQDWKSLQITVERD